MSDVASDGISDGGDAVRAGSSVGTPSKSVAKGYAFVEIEILDPAGYRAEYVPRALAAVERHGGRFLHSGRSAVAKSGDLSGRRIVLIEFPTFGTAVAFYESPEYSEAIVHRDRYAKVHRYYLLPADAAR